MIDSTPPGSQSRRLEYQILDSFTGGNSAVRTLLSLMDIVETTEIPTAAVECVAVPRMLINPEFVAAHANTPEKLLMLVMHELHHVILGHTSFFGNTTPIDNLVFDAVINAMLCHDFPGTAQTSFFTDLYREDAFPECLLRPATGWKPGLFENDPLRGFPTRPFTGLEELEDDDESDMICPVPPLLKTKRYGRIASAYRELYSAFGSSYVELYEALTHGLLRFRMGDVLLLGDHTPKVGSSCGSLERRSPVLFEAVRRIVEEWPQPPEPIPGRSLSDVIEETGFEVRKHRSCRRELRWIFRRIGGRTFGGGGGPRRLSPRPSPVATPVPTFDRRSVVMRALGTVPLLYRHEVTGREWAPHDEKVHVYLDVSGSMDAVIASVYGAVLDSLEFVHGRIHLFSTEVKDISLRQLSYGACESTGGTSIGCVAEHIREHRVQKAVILTDGYVGIPIGDDEKVLRDTRLGVALVGDMQTGSDLAEVADEWVKLQVD